MSRIDWKAVAHKRLCEIRSLELRIVNIRCEIYHNMVKELAMNLHSRCIPGGNAIAREIAAYVSARMTGK